MGQIDHGSEHLGACLGPYALLRHDPEHAGAASTLTTFKKAAACALAVCSVALAVGSTLPAQASIAQPAVVSDNPSDTTPHIVFDDSSQDVRAYAQVGHTMYAGGRFNHVQNPARTTTYDRQNFVAFDRETGVISPLNLAFNGTVGAIEATANGTALFIAGSFSQVNGITRRGLVKYDLVNNRVDPTFLPGNLRTVSDIELANGSVIAAGNFAKHLVALNPTTGADTGTINITVAGVVDPTDETRVRQHRGLPERHPVGGHGQLRHGQRPEPPTGVHAEPRRDRHAEHLARPPLRRGLLLLEHAGQRTRRGLLSRRHLLRDRGHRRADWHHRDV